jgi:hypothetical protein
MSEIQRYMHDKLHCRMSEDAGQGDWVLYADHLAEVERLEKELQEQERHNEALVAKFEGCPHRPINIIPGVGVLDLCGCSYDAIGDVCAHHAPALRDAKAEVERLRNQVSVLREALTVTQQECCDWICEPEHTDKCLIARAALAQTEPRTAPEFP